jgi:capsular exopolysaccharide synthesis family protein
MEDKNIETAVLKRALTLYFKYWQLIVTFVVLSAVGSIFQHYMFPSYLATATLHITSFDDSYLLNSSSRKNQSERFSAEPLNKKYIKIIGSNNFSTYARNYVENILKNPELKSKNEIFETLPLNLTSRQYTNILFSYTQFKGEDDDLINIMATSENARTASSVANFMSELAKNYIYEYESKQIADAEEYLDNEIYLGQVRIDQLNKAIEDYKEKQDMLSISMGETNSTVVRSLGKLKEELELLKVHIEENKILASRISKTVTQRKFVRGVATEAPIDIAPLRGRLVDKLRSLDDENVELDAKKNALTRTIDSLAQSMKPEYEQKIYDYKKKLDIEHNIFQELKKQLFDTRVYKIAISNRIRPYNLAFAEGITSHTPLPKKLVMSMMISFFISFLLIYFWEQLYPTIYEKKDLNQLGVRHLGNLPYIGEKESFIQKIFLNRNKKNMAFHICQFNIKSNETAAFQFLRTRILSVLNKRTQNSSGQIMSIMSSKPGDGKSVIAMNLAVCMSNYGVRTLLIDCDLLKSTLSAEFDLREQEGLSGVLENKTDPLDSILSTGHENLHFLPSGNVEKNFELLSSTQIEFVLKDLRKQYDLIILDTPAFKAGPEGLVLANHSDLCLLVANAHTTKLDEIREILEHIPHDSAGKVYGVINRYHDVLDFNKKLAYYY